MKYLIIAFATLSLTACGMSEPERNRGTVRAADALEKQAESMKEQNILLKEQNAQLKRIADKLNQ